MNKEQLIAQIAKKTGSTQKDAENLFNAYVDVKTEALVSEEEVQLIGFGKFEVVNTPAKTGRNPQNGQPIQIPAKKVVKFRVGKRLKDAVNG